MAETAPVRVTLPADAPIFADLARFAVELERRGETLRVVGGVAMTIWGMATGRPRGVTTNDIDSVVPRAAIVDAASARAYRDRIDAATAAAGYVRAPADRPADRFAFVRKGETDKDGRKIELLVGNAPIGRTSSRPPPTRHLVEEADGRALIAAENDWLDLVPEPWALVEAGHAVGTARFEIPRCAGLYALKLRAVRDKQSRCDEERDAQRLKHEADRLARHLDDLALAADFLGVRGETEELRSIADGDPRVGRAARDAERWFLTADGDLIDGVLGATSRVRSRARLRDLFAA